jgi:very-short-patch-repair endonuclease
MRGGSSTIGRARRLRRDTTEAERLLWAGLRNDQLGWRFRRQHPIPPYIVDFACVEARLVVEADGGQNGRVGDHDTRDEMLRRSGWRVLRFWNNDILENRAGVQQTIAAALGPRLTESPHPDPPRARGGNGMRMEE